MARGGKRRLYEPRALAQEPAWIKHAGSLFKISGLLLQGDGRAIMVLYPTSGEWGELEIVPASVELLGAFLKRTDDPLIFEQDETGTIKAVVRKAQYAISGAVQQQVWARDDFQCMYCGAYMGDRDVVMTIDHWIPVQLGGAGTIDNLLSACVICNKSKADNPPEKWCDRQGGIDYFGLSEYLAGRMPKRFIGHLIGS